MWTFFTSITSRHGCIIVCVGTIMACCCFFSPNTTFLFANSSNTGFENQFVNCANFFITCCVFLLCVGLWYKLNHIVTHCCRVCCIHGTIFAIFHQPEHIVAYIIKNNLMDILKRITRSGFMWQCYYIIVVETTQYRKVHAIPNWLVAQFLIWWENRNPGVF